MYLSVVIVLVILVIVLWTDRKKMRMPKVRRPAPDTPAMKADDPYVKKHWSWLPCDGQLRELKYVPIPVAGAAVAALFAMHILN